MKSIRISAALLFPLGISGAAFAQTVDYDGLQSMFGEPVTTSATGKPQRQSEAPASMIIITGEDARRTGARTIPDILQNFAGIDVNRYATAQRDVGVRGANMPVNPRLLVLVNGHQAYLDHYGYTDWGLLGVEMSDIQQIEVVKGPNSALFGFNAVAGVVNIITIDPLVKGNSFRANVEGGTDDAYALSMVGAMKVNEKLAFKVSGGLSGEDDWEELVSLSDYAPHQKRFSIQLTAQLAKNIRANASYSYANAKSISQAYLYNLVNNDTTLENISGTVTAETKAGLITAILYKNKMDQNLVGTSDLLVAKLEDLFKVGTAHSLRMALEYRRSEFMPKNEGEGDPFFVGKTFVDVYSGSSMWEWQMSEKLILTNALRVDRVNLGHGPISTEFFPYTVEDYDRSTTEYSYNTSLGYVIDDQTRVRVSAARGAQSPSLAALGFFGGIFEGRGTAYVGAPFHEASINKSYEIALDRDIPALKGGFNLTASRTQVSDFISAGQNTTLVGLPTAEFPYLQFSEEVIGDFKSYTIEATLNGRAVNDKLSWQINYTWTDIKEDFLRETAEMNLTLDEGTPAHKVNLKFDYVDGPWNAFLVGRYRSSTQQRIPGGITYAGLADLGGNITVDARVAYNFDHGLSVWLSGENLTSNKAAGLSVYRADTRALLGFGVSF